MREIKFRAWDAPKETMQYQPKLTVVTEVQENDLTTRVFERFEPINAVLEKYADTLMQYTGLTDKNGVEIYEGDIVSIGDGELIEEIKWIKEKQWMRGECPFSKFVNHDAIYKSGVQVIGNIYENPELLTK